MMLITANIQIGDIKKRNEGMDKRIRIYAKTCKKDCPNMEEQNTNLISDISVSLGMAIKSLPSSSLREKYKNYEKV